MKYAMILIAVVLLVSGCAFDQKKDVLLGTIAKIDYYQSGGWGSSSTLVITLTDGRVYKDFGYCSELEGAGPGRELWSHTYAQHDDCTYFCR